MTLFNRSFEVPDGVAPSLVSRSSEPFVLAHGQPIDFRARAPGGVDIVERYTVNAADFADVTQATAAELGAAMGGSLTQFMAADVGAVIVVASFYSGAGSSIQVVSSGGVQAALNFPTEPAFGTTYPGPPQGWTVTSTATYWEWASFNSFNFGSPAEGFEQDWGQTTSSYGPPVPFTEAFETGWAIVVVGGAHAAGTFDGGASQTEDFENLWNIYSPASPLTLSPASFAGPASTETYESGWNVVAPGVGFTDGSFDLGLDSIEDFEQTTTATHAVLIPTDPPDGPYRVFINGTPYLYTASGDASAGVMFGLEAAITANTQMSVVGTTVNASFARLLLAPLQPVPAVVPVVQVEGPTSGSIIVQLATHASSLADRWVGQDHNFTF